MSEMACELALWLRAYLLGSSASKCQVGGCGPADSINALCVGHGGDGCVIDGPSGHSYQDIKFADGNLIGSGDGVVDWYSWPSMNEEALVRLWPVT